MAGTPEGTCGSWGCPGTSLPCSTGWGPKGCAHSQRSRAWSQHSTGTPQAHLEPRVLSVGCPGCSQPGTASTGALLCPQPPEAGEGRAGTRLPSLLGLCLSLGPHDPAACTPGSLGQPITACLPQPSSTLLSCAQGPAPCPAQPSAVPISIPQSWAFLWGHALASSRSAPGWHISPPTSALCRVPGACSGTGLLLSEPEDKRLNAGQRGLEGHQSQLQTRAAWRPQRQHTDTGLAGGGLLYWPLSPWLQITHTGQLMEKKPYIQSVHINISNVHFIHK